MHRRILASASPLTLFVVSCSLLLVLHQAALLYVTYSGHDQAWYLFAAERVLNGAQLYGPYVSDTNPPMIVWFSMLPVLLSRVLPLSETLCLRLIVLVLLLGSTTWCLRILRHVAWMEETTLRALVGLGILYVGLRIVPSNFGQREHLFVILTLPYLFAVSTGAVDELSRAERCALGLAAGMAICFKPQHALALVAAEMVLLVNRRTLRRLISPEVLTLMVSGVVYLVAVRVVTPRYTKEIVPLLLDTYWAYGTASVAGLLFAMKMRLLVACALFGVSVFLLHSHPLSLAVATFAACSVGSMLAYALQRTGWPYHRYPSSSFLILAAVLLVLNISQPFLRRWEGRTVGRPVAYACLAAVLLAGFGFFPRQLARAPLQRSEVYRFLEERKGTRTVFVFSTTVGWMADVLDLRWNWGARFPCLWFVPAIVQNEHGLPEAGRPFKRLGPERLAAISSIQRTEVAEDLNRFQPSVVMVEHCDREHECQAIEGKSFNTLSWFLEDSRFVEAWSHYRRDSAGPASFDVYFRTP